MGNGILGNNISEKYKTQWIAPERTGSRKLAEILCYYGFTNNGKNVYNFGKYGYTHIHDSTKYVDYKILCSTRNPYSRVLSLFKNFYQHSKDKTKDSFKKYLKYELPKGQMYQMVVNPVLSKAPDYFVRLEYMADDLLKVPFISDVLTENQIRMLSEHGKPIDEWESYYDDECRDIVYNLIPNQFQYFGYSK